MELEKYFLIFATLVFSSCGFSIDAGKLLVPHSSNDLLRPEDDFHGVIKPINYQALLNPSHNHRQNFFSNNHKLVSYLKPIFNKPLKNFYNKHLKHWTRKPHISPFQIDAGIDLSKHHRFREKPVVEHIEDDFKYDFKTDTYSFK